MKPSNNGNALIKTIKQLRELFHRQYPEGGWLPPVREMADRFGVSLMTYHKAITRMVKENFVISYPKKGYFVVPEYLRCRKIGLIFDDGMACPFIGQCRIVTAILEVIEDQHFAAQVLQAASFDQLYILALAHGIEGLIWFDPPYQAVETIDAIDRNGEFPLVIVQLNRYLDGLILGKSSVTYDVKYVAEQRAKLLKHLGHSRIIYTGRSFEEAKRMGVIDAFKEYGIPILPEYCVHAPQDEPGKLSEMLMDHQISVVMSEGGGILIDYLFAELSKISDTYRPQVLVSEFSLLPTLFERYPSIKHVPQPGKQNPDIGQVASKMLFDHILHGKKLSRKMVGTKYEIPQ